jgi:hypothetical protein
LTVLEWIAKINKSRVLKVHQDNALLASFLDKYAINLGNKYEKP